MRGKFVNLGFGIINIVFGTLIIIYGQFIPKEISELTVQEQEVKFVINILLKVILIIISIMNIVAFLHNRKESNFKSAYRIATFSLVYLIFPKIIVAILPILAGILIIKTVINENLIQIDSTVALSFILLVLGLIILTGIICLKYQDIAEYRYDKQNEDMQEYSKSFFKYITPIETDDIYINVKVNGKYGYINQNGETVIDFKYDFASPFIKIIQYNKEFEIALVCRDEVSNIIMKNERIVKSYITESSNQDYNSKIEELKKFYTDELNQTDEMKFEIQSINNRKNKIKAYTETSTEYTHRFDFNDEYDVMIIASSMGLTDTYYLVKKDNDKIKIKLECNNLDYDDNFLYLYSNGYLPYYSVGNREQGWFNEYGQKITMQGKAQILELIDGNILLRNYNDNTVYFMNGNQEIISSIYKDIYINSNEYIVKNTNGKFTIINKEFSQIINEEYDFIDTSISEYGLYVCGNFEEKIDIDEFGYIKNSLKLIDSNGNVLLEGIEQVYNIYNKIREDIKQEEAVEELKNNMIKLNYEFVGDKFYEKYR